ncbi:hypothetical protein [Paraburkholderia humisilvae]|uniref:Uncharacterized protein n=2 Tax=Paraburkholderia humisilvae TaxID=627669 RepID=A0A6J5DKE3_9BURK|nr:hypothetical protein [Paraburkholderia humisilvae]CAB3753934.1 hypothetical protein LMG29542_02194 [Paraburkholderia humisilvae]
MIHQQAASVVSRPLEPDPFASDLAAVILGKRIETDHRDYNALLARLRGAGRPVELAFYGPDAATAGCVIEAVADVNLRAIPAFRILSRIASLKRRQSASLSADMARFDPARLGGRGAAGRQRDRARSAEQRLLLANRIRRLTAELERREKIGQGQAEG